MLILAIVFCKCKIKKFKLYCIEYILGRTVHPSFVELVVSSFEVKPYLEVWRHLAWKCLLSAHQAHDKGGASCTDSKRSNFESLSSFGTSEPKLDSDLDVIFRVVSRGQKESHAQESSLYYGILCLFLTHNHHDILYSSPFY